MQTHQKSRIILVLKWLKPRCHIIQVQDVRTALSSTVKVRQKVILYWDHL